MKIIEAHLAVGIKIGSRPVVDEIEFALAGNTVGPQLQILRRQGHIESRPLWL